MTVFSDVRNLQYRVVEPLYSIYLCFKGSTNIVDHVKWNLKSMSCFI